MQHQLPAVAVIGAGQWGINHVRNFAELGALAMVVDPDEGNQRKVRDRWPDVALEVGIDAALRSEAIDGIVIAAPAPLHYSLAERALLAGKDVFVEKPLALSVEEGEALCQIAERDSRILMIGHLLWYHAGFQRLVELVRQPGFGPIRQVWSHRLQYGRFRHEENALWSLAPHDISMVNGLLGGAPDRLRVVASNSVSPRLVDNVFLGFDYNDGRTGHVHVSWHYPFREHRVAVAGQSQMVVFDDDRPWPEKVAIYHHGIAGDAARPVAVKCPDAEFVPVEPGEALANECRHFLDCITTRRKPLTDGREALAVLQVLAEAQRQIEASGLE